MARRRKLAHFSERSRTKLRAAVTLTSARNDRVDKCRRCDQIDAAT